MNSKKSVYKSNNSEVEAFANLSIFGHPLCCSERRKEVGPENKKDKSVQKFAESFGHNPLRASRSVVKLPPIGAVPKNGSDANSKKVKPSGNLINATMHKQRDCVKERTSFLDWAAETRNEEFQEGDSNGKGLPSTMKFLYITSKGIRSKQEKVDLNVEGESELLKTKP